MLARPTALALIVTNRCTAACDHCCFHCSPRASGTIPFRRLSELIDEATALNSIAMIVFTGGEPFLLGGRLIALVRHARRCGFLTRCVTNGYWARSDRLARERVAGFREAGLNELNLSTGPFHAEHVPVERVIRAASTACDAGLVTLVTVETFAGSEVSPDTLLADKGFRQRYSEGRLILRRNVWIANKGCSPLRHAQEQCRFNDANKSGCETVLNVVGVTPELKLLACCGLHANRIPDLAIGDVSTASLRDTLDHAPDDLLKMWLHVEGPERILEFLAERDRSLRLPRRAVHTCETCRYLFGSTRVRSLLRRHYRSVEPRVVERFLTSLALADFQRKTILAAHRQEPVG